MKMWFWGKGNNTFLLPSLRESWKTICSISVLEKGNRCNKIKQTANSALPVSETQSVARPSGKSSTALFFWLEPKMETLMSWGLLHAAQTQTWQWDLWDAVQALVGMELPALHKHSEACLVLMWGETHQDSPVPIEKWRETFGIVATILPFCFLSLPINFFFLLFNSRAQIVLCFTHGTSAPSTFVSPLHWQKSGSSQKKFPLLLIFSTSQYELFRIWSFCQCKHSFCSHLTILCSLLPWTPPPSALQTELCCSKTLKFPLTIKVCQEAQTLALASHEEYGLFELSSWAELADSELLGDIHLWTASHCLRLLFTCAKFFETGQCDFVLLLLSCCRSKWFPV